jgi:hypothetical protein
MCREFGKPSSRRQESSEREAPEHGGQSGQEARWIQVCAEEGFHGAQAASRAMALVNTID